jgi:hypothetical protein
MFSHPDVDSLSAEQVEQKITQGKARSALLESVFRKPKFLRFLYDSTIQPPRSCLLTATVWLRAQSTTQITNLTKPRCSIRHANWRELMQQLPLG